MERVFRIVKRLFVILTLLLVLAIPLVGMASAALNWRGVCSTFTEGQAPCSWWEFARNEMFWAMFIFIPFFFLASLAYLGMSLIQFAAAFFRKRKPPVSQA